jgi:hypothetical protein
MTTSDTIPVIIGAAIGAGGAVIAQVVSSLFTARRERGQLDWERNRQEHEWKMRKEERFLILKQEAYGSVMLMANTFLTYIYYAIDYARSEPVEPRPTLPNLQEMLRHRSNIEIIAPKVVSDPVRIAVIKLIEVKGVSDSPQLSRERIKKEADEAESKWREAYRAMRADLHGGDERFSQAGAKELDLPPDDEPPAHRR